MSSAQQLKKYYLICYDIEKTKQRTKLAKWLSDYAIRVQKSVFEAYLAKDHLEEMISGAQKYINEGDSFRVYGLSKNAYQNKITIGQSFEHDPTHDIIL